MIWRLYDAGLVRQLRKAAKERAYQTGIRGYRKRWWSGSRTGGQNRFLYLWLGFIAIRMMMERAGSPTGATVISGCATLAFAGVALQRMKSLRKALTFSFERAQSYFYPVPESEFVTGALFRTARDLWWLPLLGLGVFRVLQREDSTAVWILAGLAAIAEMFVVLALVYGLERYLEVIPRWLSLAFFGMAALWLMVPTQYTASQQSWVNALPTGWVNLVVLQSGRDEERIAALVIATGVFGGAAWLLAKRRGEELVESFQQSLEAGEETRAGEEAAGAQEPGGSWTVLEEPEMAGIEEEGEFGAVQPLPMQATWQRQKIAAIGEEWGELVRQGHWLKRGDWSQLKWIEGAVAHWLNEEEQDTFWFLTGGKLPDWSNQWKNSVIALAVGILLMNVLQADWRWLGVVAILASILMGLPVGGGKWMATSPAWISGKIAPMYATYPLGYSRGSRVMAKASLVRTAAWVPLLVILAITNARLAKASIGNEMLVAAKVLLIWLAWIPFTILGKFSKGSNDSSFNSARRLLLIPVGIVVASAQVILAGATFMSEGPEGFLAGGLAIALSLGTWAMYGFWYNREVDLLRERE